MDSDQDNRHLAASLQLGLINLSRALSQVSGADLIGHTADGYLLLTLFARGPQTVAALHVSFRVASPAIRVALHRLEHDLGAVEPRDDGKWQVTDAGRELIYSGRAAHIDYLASELARTSPEEFGTLTRAVDLLERLALAESGRR